MKYLLILILSSIITTSLFSQRKDLMDNKVEESYEILFSKVDSNLNIWQAKSCFPQNYRIYKRNNSTVNLHWTYENDQFFDDAGCYVLITRGEPDKEGIKNHLVQISSLKPEQITIKD